MKARRPAAPRGFSLIEAMVAVALLGMLMASVAASQGDSMYRAVEVMNLTNATQMFESVVLNLEEEYRLDGFPDNKLEGRDCDDHLPKGFKSFRCEFDLIGLEIGADNVSSLGAEATETIANSTLMNTFCNAEGGAAAANIAAVCSQVQGVAGAMASQGMALPPELSAFAPLCDPGLSQICGVNLGKMCQNSALITSFIPTIIEQAAMSTRKLRVRISWGDPDEEGLIANVMKDGKLVSNMIEIETFITAVPEAEPEQ